MSRTGFPEPPEDQWPPRDTEPLRRLRPERPWRVESFSTEAFPASEYRAQVYQDIEKLSDTDRTKLLHDIDHIDRQLQLLCVLSILLLISILVLGVLLYSSIEGVTILVPKP